MSPHTCHSYAMHIIFNFMLTLLSVIIMAQKNAKKDSQEGER